MVDLKFDIDNGVITCIHDIYELEGKLVERKGRLFVPKEVIGFSNEACVNFDPMAIEVEEGNNVYYAKNNCLIREEDKVLVMGCSNSKIPEDGSVCEIGACAFNTPFDLSAMNLNPLVIPDSIKKIGYRAFAVISDNPIHIIVPKSVEAIATMAFMAKSEAGPIIITIEGSPKLEPGVFGTKAESRDSNSDIYKTLANIIYTKPEELKVRCHRGSSVEKYCGEYGINCEII